MAKIYRKMLMKESYTIDNVTYYSLEKLAEMHNCAQSSIAEKYKKHNLAFVRMSNQVYVTDSNFFEKINTGESTKLSELGKQHQTKRYAELCAVIENMSKLVGNFTYELQQMKNGSSSSIIDTMNHFNIRLSEMEQALNTQQKQLINIQVQLNTMSEGVQKLLDLWTPKTESKDGARLIKTDKAPFNPLPVASPEPLKR